MTRLHIVSLAVCVDPPIDAAFLVWVAGEALRSLLLQDVASALAERQRQADDAGSCAATANAAADVSTLLSGGGGASSGGGADSPPQQPETPPATEPALLASRLGWGGGGASVEAEVGCPRGALFTTVGAAPPVPVVRAESLSSSISYAPSDELEAEVIAPQQPQRRSIDLALPAAGAAASAVQAVPQSVAWPCGGGEDGGVVGAPAALPAPPAPLRPPEALPPLLQVAERPSPPPPTPQRQQPQPQTPAEELLAAWRAKRAAAVALQREAAELRSSGSDEAELLRAAEGAAERARAEAAEAAWPLVDENVRRLLFLRRL